MSDQHGRIPEGSGGDDVEWMARFTELPDHEVDALLGGSVPEGLGDLAPVAEVAAALRQRAQLEEAPPMSAALRAQLDGATVVPIDRARLVRRPLLGAAAAAAVVLLALVLGASQEVLPDSVQRVVSSVADRIGLDLPSPDDELDDSVPASAESDAPGETPGETPGGATPADPGDPGDPATPATPPSGQGGGNGNAGGVDPGEVDNNGLGDGVGGGQGQTGGQSGGQGQSGGGQGGQGGQDSGAPPGNSASEQGQANGTGANGGGSSASGQGQQQGTGTGKGAKG